MTRNFTRPSILLFSIVVLMLLKVIVQLTERHPCGRGKYTDCFSRFCRLHRDRVYVALLFRPQASYALIMTARVHDPIFHFFANSIPSAIVATLASIAYPSASSFRHSPQRSFSGSIKVVMNSLSSSSVFRFSGLFSGKLGSISTWTRTRLVFVKPGSQWNSYQTLHLSTSLLL